MLKTISIKTNNNSICNYLLNEFNYFELNETRVSFYKFKHYKNTIIHYTGKNVDLFLTKISTLLAYIVIDFYEPKIIQDLININYFYFSTEDKKQIYNLCLTNVDFTDSISMFNTISNAFHEYFQNNKYIILDGFVNFRLKDYMKKLDSIVDMCVNKFIIDREYHEFIDLLKTYIKTTPCNCSIIHLIYKNNESILLDCSKQQIPYNNKFLLQKYLSDITFSSNDYALNSLLTLLPNKLYIHLINDEDDFISTLKQIFDKHAYICRDCDLCKLYREKIKL